MWSSDWQDDNSEPVRRPRSKCICEAPVPSVRPGGSFRHLYCTVCQGQWDLKIAIDAGLVAYGWYGKRKRKPLYVPTISAE